DRTYPHHIGNGKTAPQRSKDNLGVTRLPHCGNITQGWDSTIDGIGILNLLDTVTRLAH
ncbi:unnamed protein product, partial [Ilex paraguariensis]